MMRDDFRKLEGYEKSLMINDYDNREGIASKVFFTSLYGEDFIRFPNKSYFECFKLWQHK
jgi:hypothetical protein